MVVGVSWLDRLSVVEQGGRYAQDRETRPAPELPMVGIPDRFTAPLAPPARARRSALVHDLLFAETAIVEIHLTPSKRKKRTAHGWLKTGLRRQVSVLTARSSQKILGNHYAWTMGYPLIPSNAIAVPPSIATLSASLSSGVPRMWSTDVLVHGNG